MFALRTTAAVVLAATVGCYSTFEVTPQSLTALDRFQDGERRTVATAHGPNIVFDRDTVLSFHDEGGKGVYVGSVRTETGVEIDHGRDRAARFSSILVNGSTFEGTTRSHEQLTIDLGQVEQVLARKPAALMTTLAIVIPCVLVTVLAAIIFMPVCQATTCFGTI